MNVYRRIEASFARQLIMRHLGASLVEAMPGEVKIRLPNRPELHQQDAYVHAGAIATVLDSACGYAALTMAEEGKGVLTVEYKINLMRPAIGASFLAEAGVVRAGRTITVSAGRFVAEGASEDEPIAMMQATIMLVPRSRPATATGAGNHRLEFMPDRWAIR